MQPLMWAHIALGSSGTKAEEAAIESCLLAAMAEYVAGCHWPSTGACFCCQGSVTCEEGLEVLSSA